MIPITLLLSGTALAACIWAIKNGQFDDLETPQLRILNGEGEGDEDDISKVIKRGK
jgi:cbb3-type cytochrome oxidase maturation protein